MLVEGALKVTEEDGVDYNCLVMTQANLLAVVTAYGDSRKNDKAYSMVSTYFIITSYLICLMLVSEALIWSDNIITVGHLHLYIPCMEGGLKHTLVEACALVWKTGQEVGIIIKFKTGFSSPPNLTQQFHRI